MSKYVVNSFKYEDEEDFDDIRPRPFLFDVSSPTAFLIISTLSMAVLGISAQAFNNFPNNPVG